MTTHHLSKLPMTRTAVERRPRSWIGSHFAWRIAAAIVFVSALWSADAQAQILFRETFGSVGAQLPTATSTADGNWTSATCANGQIVGGGSPSDSAVSTHFLLHFTQGTDTGFPSCTYPAGQAVWRTVTAIPVQPNTTYVFSYWSSQRTAPSPAVLSQVVVPDAGTITVNNTTNPAWSSLNTWVQRSVTFTTGAATTAVNLRIHNANSVGGGNDFGIDDIMLFQPLPFAGCTTTPYLAQSTGTANTGLFQVNTTTNPFTYATVGPESGLVYNAIAFNPADNYIYGIEVSTNTLVRVGSDGSVARLGAITNLPVPPAGSPYNTGEIGSDGTYYVKLTGVNNLLYRINISTRTAATPATTLNQTFGTADFAWYNGLLYSADDNQLRSINPANGVVTNIGSGFTGPTVFGAMISASNGVFGVANEGGFYQFNTTTGSATLLSGSPTSAGNDGAKCGSTPLTLPADLAITKTDNQSVYVPGTNVVYTIVVSNSGPFGAAGVSVTDPLPTGITTASWTCSPTAGGAACGAASGSGALNTTANLPVGGSVTYTVTMAVPANFTGNLINTATITPSSATTDSNSANNTATDTDTQFPACNLAANGSFEIPNIQGDPANPAPGTTYVNGWAVWRTSNATIDGWQVVSGTVDILRYYTNASNGDQSIDLWGTAPATVQQTFTGLTPGQTYSFSIDYSGLSTTNSVATLLLDLGAGFQAIRTLSPIANGVANGNAGLPTTRQYTVTWSTFTYTFVATGTQATIRFVNRVQPDPTNTGLFIDNFNFGSAAPCEDYGDAPTSYGILAADNGPRHGAAGFDSATNRASLILGDAVTIDANGKPGASAALDGYDDGLVAGSLVLRVGATSASATIRAVNTNASGATLAGWIDFNANGTFDPGERAEVPIPANTTTATPFTLTWSGLAAIPGGASTFARFRVATNAAEVASPLGVANDGEVEDYMVTVLPAEADVAITKVGPASATVGANVTYTLTVTNNGPSVSTAVLVSDPTPSGMTFVSNTGDCTGPFPCALGDLAPGATRTITTTFAIPIGSNSPSVMNTATVSTTTADPAPGNNTASATTTVDISADVAVTKTVTPSSGVLVGDQVIFTIGASNNGPNTATGVVVTDLLPAGFTFVSATPSQGAYAPASGTWTIGTLNLGNPPVTLQIVARVTQPGALTNTATRTGMQQPDLNSANDSAVASINAAPSADVGVSKTVNNVSPSVGDIVTFLVTATNFGPSPVTNVLVRDLLPPGLTFQTATPSAGSYANATGDWTVGDLALNASATLTITAQVATAGPIVNTITRVSQTEADVNPANDTASVSLNAIPSSDLQVTKGVSDAAPAIGSDVTFTVTIRNNGPSSATSVVVNDTLPAGLTFVSATPSQGSYDGATGVWSVGSLGITQTATLSLTARVDGPTPATLTNTASSSGSEPDPNPGNNAGSATITSQIVADLVISKTDGLTNVVPGQPLTYTIVVSNRGPSPVTAATVSDTFPASIAGVTWTCAAAPPSACGAGSGAGPIATTVDLPVGGSATFSATGTLDPAAPSGTLTNTATVGMPAGATDADPSNNAASDVDTIVPTADVQITKSGPANVVAGTNVTYTLTVGNNGPSTATAVSVGDPAPAGLTFVSATAPCASGVTPCALGDLPPGAVVNFTVTFAVPPGYTTPDPITNSATASTTATDPQPANNTATAQTALAAPVTDLGVTKTNSTATVVPGTTTTYTIRVTNAGPSDAVNAPVTDTLDPAKVDIAGASWTCVATGSASCGAASGTGNLATTVSIAADATGTANFVVFTLDVPVRADATGVLVNTVTVNAGPGQSDPNTTNDTDTDTLTPQADLAITKTGPATATPGTTVSYTITVTNNGPSNADGVAVADATPSGLTFVSNAGDCTTPFPCALGLVTAGTTRTITVTYQMPAGYTTPDPVVNTATVSSGTPDTNAANDTSSASSTVTPSANVRITKTGPSVIIPGTTASYTLTVVNDGPSVATNVIVDDPAPTGLTPAGVDGPCASLPCTIGSLAVGAPVTFTVRFAVPANYTAPNPVQNTATVTSNTTDPDPADNTTTIPTPLAAPIADLSVDKSGPTTVAPGGGVSYTIVVRNAGPGAVTDGVLTDVLPLGVTFGSISAPPTGACTGSSTITCTGLVLPAGGSITLTVNGTVAADLEIGAVLTNVVTITSPTTTDPTPDNNRDQVGSRVGAATEADVAITKTDALDPVAVGDTVTYTLTVTNYGPANATNVSIVDSLPAGLTLNTVSGACAALPCTVPSLVAGQQVTLTVTATASTPGVVANTATASAAEPDPIASNNTATEPTTIAANATDADLALVKTGPARAGVGQAILYTLTVTNRGPGTAANVQVDDSVPSGLTVTSVAAAQGACTIGTSIACTLGSIPAGGAVTIDIVASATTTGPLANTATATSSTPDPDPWNNTSTVTTEATDPSSADLAIVKVDSPDPVLGGTPLQYVLTITNRGPGVATGASVTDPLPAGMTAVSAVASVGACGAGTTITCTFGDLAPGAIATVVVATTAPAALPAPNPMLNTATVTSAATDPDPANNSATEPTTVVGRADLSVVKSTAQASVVPGTLLTYTLTVSNNGPSAAEGVVVTDPPPAGLNLVSASAPCAGGFPCALGTLTPGATVAITVTYRVPSSHSAPNPIVNTATVASTTPDRDPANNSSTVSTPLAPPQSDLTMAKSGPATVLRGGQATYLLTVTNAGPSDAPDVTLNDPTPTGLVFVSASAPCAGGFPCALGSLAGGATTTVTVTFEVPANYNGPSPIMNTASVTTTATDPDPANNTSSVPTDVIETADLRVTKTVDNRAPAIDTRVRFTVTVFNAGPSNATGVELVDQLPAGLTFVGATPSQGTFDAATGLWTIGALANGASASLTLDAIAARSGPLANVATITHTDHLDRDPSNNSAGAALNVPLASDLQVLKTADVSTAGVGGTVTFTITVRNAGPDDAPAVEIDETLPAGLLFQGAAASAGSYDAATGLWTVGPLPNGGIATLQVSATVQAAGTLVNTARVTGAQPFDPNPGNDTSGIPINGVGADLQVVKTADRTAAAVGDRVTFTIVVTNNGPGDATGVQVRESLPTGLSYVSSTASQGLYVPETGLWTVGALTAPNGGTSRATLQVVADVIADGAHRNVASIASQDQPDPTPGNDVSGVDIESDIVDLEAGLTFIGDADAVGRLFDIFVSVTNRGRRATQQPLLVAIPFPRELSFTAPTTTWPCEAVGRTLFCEHVPEAPLASDASRTFTYWADVAQVFPRGLAAYAHVVSPLDDNVRNNVGSVLLTPPAHDTADLQVTQTIASSASAPGEAVVYRVEVANLGASPAHDVTLIDVLPAGLTLVSIDTEIGACAGTRRLACALGTLAPQQRAILSVRATATAPGLIAHTVSVSGREVDPDLTNNAARVTFGLSAAVDPTRDSDGDGMPDLWESAMGLDPAVNDAASDPDGDGLTNAREADAGTHPRGFYKQYFAEGVANAFFNTTFDMLNVDTGREAAMVSELMTDTGEITGVPTRLAPLGRYTGDAREMLAGREGSFSVVVESDRPFASDRLTTWDGRGYGSGLETGLAAPSTTWFFAEGATNQFRLFYLLVNPDLTTPAAVTVRYLLPAGSPVTQTYTIAPHSRLTIPVNEVPGLASVDVSAEIVASHPIVAERAMYRSTPSAVFDAGHVGAGATNTSASWYFAEGATGDFFDLYLLLANPNASPVDVTVQYQLPDGRVVPKTYAVGAAARRTIIVKDEDAQLTATSVAMAISSSQPIVAERAMWWPVGVWYEAHVVLGATATGTRWALAGGALGGASGDSTYALIANQAATAGQARVTLVFDDGTRVTRILSLPPTSRTTVDVATVFPEAAGRRFSIVIESVGAAPVPLVVEGARYSSTDGRFWSAGGAMLGTRLQ
jgi:uncharacterized repeat protein (TIGR01451 family)